MNSLMQNHVDTLDDMLGNDQVMDAQMYMDSMQMPYDVQDRIVGAVNRLNKITPNKVAVILEYCQYSQMSDKLRY